MSNAAGQRTAIVDSKHYAEEKLQVDQREFTREGLLNLAKEFSRSHREVSFARLIIGTGPEIRDYVGKGSTHTSPDGYFFRLPIEFPEGLRVWLRLAMVLKVGPSVLLRIREEGKITEVAVSGRNLLPVGTKGYEILDIAPLYDPPEEVGGVEVFVRGRRSLRQADVDSIGEGLCTLQPGFSIYVFARRDSWFLDHPQFPFLYAFDPGYQLPTPEKYRHDPEVWSILSHCKEVRR